MRFTYRSGQRPLAGYTLKRGVGQGGFGEVYFAVSDGGKEVALKLLRGQSDVELRGVANCLNLKHPNLVHVYDLKQDDRGDQWLIMEYVLGESLSAVIDRHPTGLPVHLAATWFQTLAKAVGYLHDHGVVHRDLKPANVFVENGTLKVGDYGLCKSMSGSGRQQTQSVGTVHYMAPEIGTGNYNKSIDIYACGVILHEMLTGKLPFDGETDGEILMKHLTATPALDGVPNVFKEVVARSLDKNPVKRYATMAEFARAVEAAYPTLGTVPAPPVAKPVSAAEPQQPPPLPVPPPPVAKAVPVAVPLPAPPVLAAARPVPVAPVVRDRLLDVTGGMVKLPFVAAAVVVPWALITQTWDWAPIGRMFLLTLAVGWSMLALSFGSTFRKSDTWGRRFRQAAAGLAIGLLAFYLDGWTGPSLATAGDGAGDAETFLFDTVQMSPQTLPTMAKYGLYFGCVLGACRWWRMAAKDRDERFTLAGPIAAGCWGALFLFLWPYDAARDAWAGFLPLVLSAAAVQWVAPWQAPAPALPKKLKLARA